MKLGQGAKGTTSEAHAPKSHLFLELFFERSLFEFVRFIPPGGRQHPSRSVSTELCICLQQFQYVKDPEFVNLNLYQEFSKTREHSEKVQGFASESLLVPGVPGERRS